MLRSALWYWKKDLRNATRLASHIGSVFGLVMMILGGVAFIQGVVIGGMWWFLIGAFLRSAADSSYRQLLIKELLSDVPVKRYMNDNPVTVTPDISIATFHEEYVSRNRFRKYPVVKGAHLVGCITVHDIEALSVDERRRKQVGDIMTPCPKGSTIKPDTDALKLLTEISQPDATSLYMVVEGGRLVGVLSLKDLRGILAIKLKILDK